MKNLFFALLLTGCGGNALVVNPGTDMGTGTDMVQDSAPDMLALAADMTDTDASTSNTDMAQANPDMTNQPDMLATPDLSPLPDMAPLCTGVDIDCAGTCINPQTNNNNCGACGNVCAVGGTCTSGACVYQHNDTFCGVGSYWTDTVAAVVPNDPATAARACAGCYTWRTGLTAACTAYQSIDGGGNVFKSYYFNLSADSYMFYYYDDTGLQRIGKAAIVNAGGASTPVYWDQ